MNLVAIKEINSTLFEFSALVIHVDPDIYERLRIDPKSENAYNDAKRTVSIHFQVLRAWCSVNNEVAMMQKIDNLIKKTS